MTILFQARSPDSIPGGPRTPDISSEILIRGTDKWKNKTKNTEDNKLLWSKAVDTGFQEQAGPSETAHL
jgi:hypothetical protein